MDYSGTKNVAKGMKSIAIGAIQGSGITWFPELSENKDGCFSHDVLLHELLSQVKAQKLIFIIAWKTAISHLISFGQVYWILLNTTRLD